MDEEGFGLRGTDGEMERATAGEALLAELDPPDLACSLACLADSVGAGFESFSTSIASPSAVPLTLADRSAAALSAFSFFLSPLEVLGRFPSPLSSRSLPFLFPFGISFSLPLPLSFEVGPRDGPGAEASSATGGGAAAGGVGAGGGGWFFGSGGKGRALGIG